LFSRICLSWCETFTWIDWLGFLVLTQISEILTGRHKALLQWLAERKLRLCLHLVSISCLQGTICESENQTLRLVRYLIVANIAFFLLSNYIITWNRIHYCKMFVIANEISLFIFKKKNMRKTIKYFHIFLSRILHLHIRIHYD
jgi:hypothetical protein